MERLIIGGVFVLGLTVLWLGVRLSRRKAQTWHEEQPRRRHDPDLD